MVGIVVVSHSAHLAEGVIELARLVSADCPIAAAGGLEDGSFGTSYERIMNAVESVHNEDGTLKTDGDLTMSLEQYFYVNDGEGSTVAKPAPEKPKTFDEMVRCATILCENFAFVRVDFYSVNDHVYFGEMTFTPQGGAGKWEDETQNRHYGDLLKLPPKSPIPERKVF